MNTNVRFKAFALIILYIVSSAFQSARNLSGSWTFVGGIYNGKAEGAPKQYTLQKKYSALNYEAFVLEKGYEPAKYETGNYTLKGDSCTDTETWCGQPSKITNIPIHYLYTIKHDTLTFKGTLPTGMHVVEYWKRVKK